MNKARRKEIDKVVSDLERLTGNIEDLASAVETIMDEEQEAFDNLPESIQDADRGCDMQTAIDALQNALDMLGDIALDDIITTLEEAKVE